MVDKPAVTNRRDYERLEALIHRGKIQVGMLLTERYSPAIVKLKHLIDDGVPGELVTIGIRKPHRLTPAKSWTWGDGRIFVTGTEGFAEIRCSGDPFVTKDTLLLCITNTEDPIQVALGHDTETISGDFLRRVHGLSSSVNGQDILSATHATIKADEQIRVIRVLLRSTLRVKSRRRKYNE